MKGRNPLFLVREYLSASSAEVRLKAVRALREVANPENFDVDRPAPFETEGQEPFKSAVKELVKAALYDPDEGVREEAEVVIREQLAPPQRFRAIEVLHKRVGKILRKHWQEARREDLLKKRVDHRMVLKRAIGLLLEMRDRDVPVEDEDGLLRQRLRLALATREAVPAPALDTLPLRLVQALGSSAVAALTLVVSLSNLNTPVSDAALIILGVTGMVFATVFALVAPWRSTSPSSYLDRKAGALVEVLSTMSRSFLPAAALVLLSMLAWPQIGMASSWRISFLALAAVTMVLIYVGAIRFGTLVYASVSSSWQHFWRAPFWRATAGWSLGTAFSSLVLLLVGLVRRTVPADENATFAAGVSLLCLPVGLSLSWAFASIRSSKEKVKGDASWIWAPAGIGAAAALAVVLILLAPAFLWWTFWAPYHTPAQVKEITAQNLGEIFLTSSEHARVPATLRFRADFTQSVFARIVPESDDVAAELELRLIREGEAVPLTTAPEFSEINDYELRPGNYRLEATLRHSLLRTHELVEELFAVARLLAHFDQSDSASLKFGQVVAPFRIHVGLNTEVERATVTALRDRLEEGDVDGALAVYEQAGDVELPLEALDRVCRVGSIRGLQAVIRGVAPPTIGLPGLPQILISQPVRVAALCDSAVEHADSTAAVNDSRALARILIGNADGAIQDLETYVAWYGDGAASDRRRRWIEMLRNGTTAESVFSRDELADLLAEASRRTPELVAREMMASRVERITQLLQKEKLGAAVEEFQELRAKVPDLDEQPFRSVLCRYAAPREPAVALIQCRRALDSSEPDQAEHSLIRASLTLALLLVDETTGTAEDLEALRELMGLDPASPDSERGTQGDGSTTGGALVERWVELTRSLPATLASEFSERWRANDEDDRQ